MRDSGCDPPGLLDPISQFQQRFGKVIVHELGHTFGLQHSANPVCVMTDYKGSMKGLDASSDSLCKGCRDAMDFLRIR